MSTGGDPFRPCQVPGMVGDPCQASTGETVYRIRTVLPDGKWNRCRLTLKGARFRPRIWVDGAMVCQLEGGMGQLSCILDSPNVKPGQEILLEVRLASLEDVPMEDASRIPDADWWRSNLSSLLWDQVMLSFYRDVELTEAIPFTDFEGRTLTLRCRFQKYGISGAFPVSAEILDGDSSISREDALCQGDETDCCMELCLRLGENCRPWSPDTPQCYTVRIRYGNDVQGEFRFTWGLRDFRVQGKKLMLNTNPVTLRACTVVWHRFLRDPEGKTLGFDCNWFLENILLRLKSHGGNAIRFHLGPPPEAFLDLCDRYGMMVQLEWSFFHGLNASYKSLVEQWRTLFLTALRHPSVVLIHLWNETEGEQLKRAFAAMEEACRGLPPMVLSHRDVIHVHKYWWSLFENVGVYYHSADQFDQPIMVDEFGGNYLDGQCLPGAYPSVRESFLRFLGRGYTAQDTLELHTEANARMAEYWRRIGASGFSPFCALGSPEDGNHHFLGPLRFGIPKPVWEATTAAWSPVGLSLAVWDRNFTPGQQVSIPLCLFNETNRPQRVTVSFCVTGEYDHQPVGEVRTLSAELAPFSTSIENVMFLTPRKPGSYRFRSWLNEQPSGVTHPVASDWRFHVIRVETPDILPGTQAAVIGENSELTAFLLRHQIQPAAFSSNSHPDMILVTPGTPEKLDRETQKALEAMDPSIPVIYLQLGPQRLGRGYQEDGSLGNLQGIDRITNGAVTRLSLMDGLEIRFQEVAEPESCLHPTGESRTLWSGLDRQATWLWNGLKGGIVAPACDMSVSSLSPQAFLEEWEARGASREAILENRCWAYWMEGFYEFSEQEDPAVGEALKQRVKLLAEDAPALANAINPNAKVQCMDLGTAYRESKGTVRSVRSLAAAGKGLFRSPLVRVERESGQVLYLSQLLTSGRLTPPSAAQTLHLPLHPSAPIYDPACEQFLCNLLAQALKTKPHQTKE